MKIFKNKIEEYLKEKVESWNALKDLYPDMLDYFNKEIFCTSSYIQPKMVTALNKWYKNLQKISKKKISCDVFNIFVQTIVRSNSILCNQIINEKTYLSDDEKKKEYINIFSEKMSKIIGVTKEEYIEMIYNEQNIKV